jgi:hypothetical protein
VLLLDRRLPDRGGICAGGELTLEAVQRWRDAPIDAWTHGKSAAYLQASGQVEDLNFILAHVNDISEAFTLEGGEVKILPVPTTQNDSLSKASET